MGSNGLTSECPLLRHTILQDSTFGIIQKLQVVWVCTAACSLREIKMGRGIPSISVNLDMASGQICTVECRTSQKALVVSKPVVSLSALSSLPFWAWAFFFSSCQDESKSWLEQLKLTSLDDANWQTLHERPPFGMLHQNNVSGCFQQP